MRNLKVLGLALLAVCALTAITAAGAQAAKVQTKFTAPETTGSVFISAEQDKESGTGEELEQVFTVNTGKIKCTAVSIPATTTVAVNATAIEVEPSYTGCKAFGLNATVTTNECKFAFSLTESESGGTVHEAGVKIVCPAGKFITVKIPVGSNCVVTVGSQTVPGDVVFTNKGTTSSRDLTLEANLSGITYTETGSNCSKPGVTSSNGTYVGKVTIKGFLNSGGVKGAQTGILID